MISEVLSLRAIVVSCIILCAVGYAVVRIVDQRARSRVEGAAAVCAIEEELRILRRTPPSIVRTRAIIAAALPSCDSLPDIDFWSQDRVYCKNRKGETVALTVSAIEGDSWGMIRIDSCPPKTSVDIMPLRVRPGTVTSTDKLDPYTPIYTTAP